MGLINHRLRFNESEHRSKFHEAISNDWLVSAIEAAMLEFTACLPTANDQLTAMANSYRIDGARKFLECFTMLTEPVPEKKTNTRANLDHRI